MDSKLPSRHPLLAYLDEAHLEGQPSPVDNIVYGLASLGLDWFVDFHLLSSSKQGDQLRFCSHQLARVPTPWCNPFFFDVWTHPTPWEEVSIDILKAEAFYGDPTVSGNEAWFLYNQNLTQQDWSEYPSDPENRRGWIKPNSHLRVYAWAFLDSPMLMKTIQYYMRRSGEENLIDTVVFLNQRYRQIMTPTPIRGPRLSRRDWDLLLDLYGCQDPPDGILNMETLFKIGKRFCTTRAVRG
ncbi:hypothetical protein F5X99DRAFT_207828 [Biscogniauxia marginata]|nr:hypothetical protein F5X99DRAFT_207828 [Biscogniauxia marginata]